MAFSDRCVLINNQSENSKNALKELFAQNVSYDQNYQANKHKQPNTFKTPRDF